MPKTNEPLPPRWGKPEQEVITKAIQNVLRLARENNSTIALANALCVLEESIKVQPEFLEPGLPTREQLIKAAREQYAEGSNDDVEIDDDAQISRNDEGSGSFVQAWVWVNHAEFQPEDTDA